MSTDSPPALTDTLTANIARVRSRIEAAATRAGRDPASINLIAVSKTHPAEACAAALSAGIHHLGENRVQEGVAKAVLVDPALRPTWHLIGHLQRNKVRDALKVFHTIHGIDSIQLAEAVNRSATQAVPVFIEVNVAGEASKFGFAPDDVPAAVQAVRQLEHLDLRGLMTVAPAVPDPEQVRPVFASLRELAQRHGLTELSMGMTNDFEVAIEEGATWVRVGRAIFGERTPAR